jgi:hypothetical protein
MCGIICTSTSPEQAVEYAIAYAVSHEDGSRHGRARQAPEERRAAAGEFIEEYVPADQREAAHALLAERTELTTPLSYWDDVVDCEDTTEQRQLGPYRFTQFTPAWD